MCHNLSFAVSSCLKVLSWSFKIQRDFRAQEIVDSPPSPIADSQKPRHALPRDFRRWILAVDRERYFFPIWLLFLQCHSTCSCRSCLRPPNRVAPVKTVSAWPKVFGPSSSLTFWKQMIHLQTFDSLRYNKGMSLVCFPWFRSKQWTPPRAATQG